MKFLLTILLSSFLVGCATPSVKVQLPQPNLDSFYTSDCRLPTKPAHIYSWEDVLAEKAERNALLLECYKRHKGSIELYRKYIKEVNDAIK